MGSKNDSINSSSSEGSPRSSESIIFPKKIKLFRDLDRSLTSLRCLTGSIICLEGLIGVGKTTTGHALVSFLNRNGFRAKFFKEKVDQVLLKQYIDDMDKYAYTFQVLMLSKRIDVYKKAHHYARRGGIAIIDRSLPGDYAFAYLVHQSGYITNGEWEVYRSLIEEKKLYPPSMIIYLQIDSEKAFDRMRRRGNDEEVSGYSLTYFKELKKCYDKVMEESERINNENILRLDWSRDKEIHNNLISDRECQKLLEDIKDYYLTI